MNRNPPHSQPPPSLNTTTAIPQNLIFTLKNIQLQSSVQQGKSTTRRISSNTLMKNLESTITQYQSNLSQFQQYMQASITKNNSIKEKCYNNLFASVNGLRDKYKQFANEWKYQLPHVCQQFMDIVQKISVLYQQEIARLVEINQKWEFSYQQLLKASNSNTTNTQHQCNHNGTNLNYNQNKKTNYHTNTADGLESSANDPQVNKNESREISQQFKRKKNSVSINQQINKANDNQKPSHQIPTQNQRSHNRYTNPRQQAQRQQNYTYNTQYTHNTPEQKQQQPHIDKLNQNKFKNILKVADEILRIKDSDISLMRQQITQLFEQQQSNSHILQAYHHSNHPGNGNDRNNSKNVSLNKHNNCTSQAISSQHKNKQQISDEIHEFRLKTSSDDYTYSNTNANANTDVGSKNPSNNVSSNGQVGNYSKFNHKNGHPTYNSNYTGNPNANSTKNSQNNSRKNSLCLRQQFWQNIHGNANQHTNLNMHNNSHNNIHMQPSNKHIQKSHTSQNSSHQTSCNSTMRFNKSIQNLPKSKQREKYRQKQNDDGGSSREKIYTHKYLQQKQNKEKTGLKLQDLKRNLYKNKSHNQCRF